MKSYHEIYNRGGHMRIKCINVSTYKIYQCNNSSLNAIIRFYDQLNHGIHFFTPVSLLFTITRIGPYRLGPSEVRGQRDWVFNKKNEFHRLVNHEILS